MSVTCPTVVHPCGKLMLAGEYAILLPDSVCLAVALPPFLFVSCRLAQGFAVRFPDLQMELGPIPVDDSPPPSVEAALPWWGWYLLRQWLESPLADEESCNEPSPDGGEWAVLSQSGIRPAMPAGEVEAVRSEVRREAAQQLRHGVEVTVGRLPGSHLEAGASAAIAVGVVVGLARACGLQLSRQTLLRIALATHRRWQGGGSGYDVATCLYGGLVRYAISPSQTIQVDSRPDLLDTFLVVAHTGTKTRTASLLEQLRHRQEDPGVVAYWAEHRRTSAALVERLWQGGEPEELTVRLRAANRSLERLADAAGLAVLTQAIRALTDAAAREGEVARVSGAGGGDFVVTITSSAAAAHRVYQGWEKAGFRAHLLLPASSSMSLGGAGGGAKGGSS